METKTLGTSVFITYCNKVATIGIKSDKKWNKRRKW
jgi:hypothetical protein